MMNDSLYRRILLARLALARILLMDYPDAESPDDLPQILVDSFDALTDIVKREQQKYYAVTHFDVWWDNRKMLRDRWKDE